MNRQMLQVEYRKSPRYIFFERIAVRARIGVYLLPAAEMVNISEKGCCIYMPHADDETQTHVLPKKSLLGCIKVPGEALCRFAGEVAWIYPHSNGFATGIHFFNRLDLSSGKDLAGIGKFCMGFYGNL